MAPDGKVDDMRSTLGSADLASTAADRAQDAARRAGVEIALVSNLREIRAVSSLFGRVWGTGDDDSYLPAGVLRAMVHAGNYAAGAYDSTGMVGAVVGFLGQDEDGPYLHSHILGVEPRRRGANVGFALKQHQRAWSLERGLRKVTWTFDPLVRKNAHFNLHKLGAGAEAYFENFYGTMDDELNAGDESDRMLIVWHLDSPDAVLAADGKLAEPDVGSDAVVALSPEAEVNSVSGHTVVCATPDDIVALRHSEPERAAAWRRALRTTLGSALQNGYSLSGFTRSGWYVLEKT